MTDEEAKSLLLKELTPEQLVAFYVECTRAIKAAYQRGLDCQVASISGWVLMEERKPGRVDFNKIVTVLELIGDNNRKYWSMSQIKVSKLLCDPKRFIYWFDQDKLPLPSLTIW